MAETKVIGKIESAFLGWEDHGIFTAWLLVDYGGSGQGIGQYAFDEYDEETKTRHGSAYGLNFIMRLMEACGVREWDKIKGRTVYVIKDGDGWNAKPIGIEPLPTEPGKRFIFDELREGVAA